MKGAMVEARRDKASSSVLARRGGKHDEGGTGPSWRLGTSVPPPPPLPRSRKIEAAAADEP